MLFKEAVQQVRKAVLGIEVREALAQMAEYCAGFAEDAKNAATTLTMDATLTQSGQAADAKAVGDRLEKLEKTMGEGAGLTAAEKALILSLFQNGAYKSGGMTNIYNQLATLWGGGTVTPDPDPEPEPEPDTPTVIPVTSVALNKSTLTLTEGDSETLTATVLPDNATNKTVSWTVSPSGYATVSAGKVTATAAGSCTVKATAGGKSANCAVTVEAAAVGPQEITIDTVITGTNRTWNYDNPLMNSNYFPITAKQDFKVKKLDFQINLTANSSLTVNIYSLTDKKDLGTKAVVAGTEGTNHIVAEFSDVVCEAGKEYQIWIVAESKCMCYLPVLDNMVAANEYFDTTGTSYKYDNTRIRYHGYVVIEV